MSPATLVRLLVPLTLVAPAATAPQLVPVQQAELVALDAAAMDLGGAATALDGDTALVGAYGDDTWRGAGYVFVRSGTVWTQQAKLVAVDRQSLDYFGGRVALDGDWAVLAASGDDDLGSESGSVYVFRRTGTVWAQVQKLVASDGQPFDSFGAAVAISFPWILVGAQADDDLAMNCGAAYFFEWGGSSFSEFQKVHASDAGTNNWFGYSAVIEGSTAVIGGYAHSHSATNAGAAYVFGLAGGSWSEAQELIATPSVNIQGFASSLALDGDRLIGGAHAEGGARGAAYVFHRVSGVWSQEARLLAHDGSANAQFGYAVGLASDLALVGAPFDAAGGVDAGRAYLFQRTGSRWVQRNHWLPQDVGVDDQLGSAAALSGTTALVGCQKQDSAGAASGSTYVLLLQPQDPGPFCFGTDAACPCGNGGAPNTGCDNAQSTGGVKLETAVFEPDGNGGGSAVFMGIGYPQSSAPTVVVMRSPGAEPVPPVFGDGLRCVALPGLVRFGSTSAANGISLHAHSHGAGAGTFFYQLWYRNNPATFCNAQAYNLSNGYELTW